MLRQETKPAPFGLLARRDPYRGPVLLEFRTPLHGVCPVGLWTDGELQIRSVPNDTHTKKRLDYSFSRSVPFPRPTASAFFSLERAKKLVHEPISRIAFNKRITKSISCHSRHNER
jgi:hypothetical protein